MHLTTTKQLGYLTIAAVLALAITVGFATVTHAQTATSTTGTTTTRYVFDATLSPLNEVPPITTTTSTTTNGGTATTTATTTGHARVWFDMTNASGTATTSTMLWKTLHVWNGDDITAAHLHCGLPGQTGPVVLDLVHLATSTDVHGVLAATSSASMSDLRATTTGCAMPIQNFTDLGNALKAGIIYANVHSVAHPSGVTRGQMVLTSSSSTNSSTTTPGTGHCVNNAQNGWYDSSGRWHSCNQSGNGNCTASSTMQGWYDSGGYWHSCGNSGNNGNCTATSTSGWYDSNNHWHSCGSGGNNGNGTCPHATSTTSGWYDSSNNWHWCFPHGGHGGNNGGGTSTPHIPGMGGLGSGINALISKIFGNVQHILNTFLPTGTNTPELRALRSR